MIPESWYIYKTYVFRYNVSNSFLYPRLTFETFVISQFSCLEVDITPRIFDSADKSIQIITYESQYSAVEIEKLWHF